MQINNVIDYGQYSNLRACHCTGACRDGRGCGAGPRETINVTTTSPRMVVVDPNFKPWTLERREPKPKSRRPC